MAFLPREKVREFIMLNLGWPTVGVELSQASLDQAIVQAIDEYISTGAVEKGVTTLDLKVDINEYELPEDVATVSKIVYMTRANNISGSTSDIFSFAMTTGEIGPNFTNFIHAAGNIGSFFEFIQNRQRVIGDDITYITMDNKLYLWPYPKMGGKVFIEYSKNTFGVLKDENISTSNQWGINWIRRYALAVAKGMLGQMRSKFGQIGGGPQGDAQTLNGADLLGQSKEEIAALREELFDHKTHQQFHVA
jgi:hypothetical protein